MIHQKEHSQTFGILFSSRRYNSFGLKGYASLLNPEFVDLDSDGDFDVFSGGVEGDFFLWTRVEVVIQYLRALAKTPLAWTRNP